MERAIVVKAVAAISFGEEAGSGRSILGGLVPWLLGPDDLLYKRKSTKSMLGGFQASCRPILDYVVGIIVHFTNSKTVTDYLIPKSLVSFPCLANSFIGRAGTPIVGAMSRWSSWRLCCAPCRLPSST